MSIGGIWIVRVTRCGHSFTDGLGVCHRLPSVASCTFARVSYSRRLDISTDCVGPAADPTAAISICTSLHKVRAVDLASH